MRIMIKQGVVPDSRWAALSPRAYGCEDELQALLNEGSTELIPQAARDAHTVFAREVATGSGPIDLVGIGSSGSITIMECKLAKSHQIKREVVGQVLDYAAALWETDPAVFVAAFATKAGSDPFETLRGLHSGEDAPWDEEVCRSEVARRLLEGDFLLLIAVDSIDPDLRRIIRFVNTRGTGGSHLHLVALAFPRYELGDTQVIVPESFGDEITPPPPPRDPDRIWDWTPEQFLDSARAQSPEAESNVRAALEWLGLRGLAPVFGHGATGPLYLALPGPDRGLHKIVKVYPQGEANISYRELGRAEPFDRDDLRVELIRRLNGIPGVTIPEGYAVDSESSYIKRAVLAAPGAHPTFFGILDWVADLVATGASSG